MKEVLLSIIIPIYNAEKYLDECISSVIDYTDNDLEIILVDDGSIDNSPNICDKWVENDNRVKCIHQKNGGPSIARNNGIKEAKGKYITFLDSDDKIFKGSMRKVLEYLSNKNNEFDLCFMNINKFYSETQILNDNENIIQKRVKNKDKLSVAKYLSKLKKFPGSPCSKIYLTEFILKNHLFFPEDNRYAEDLGFVLDCIRIAKKYDSLEFCYYLYRQQTEQTRSNTISKKLIEGIQIFISESIEKLTLNKKPRNQLDKCYLSFVAYEYQILMYFYYKSKIQDYEFLNNKKWILKYGVNIRSKIINTLVKSFGIRYSSKIIAKIKDR